MTAIADNSAELIDTQILNYIRILSEPYDVTITNIDLASRIIEFNGSERGQQEFARVLAEDKVLAQYLQ